MAPNRLRNNPRIKREAIVLLDTNFLMASAKFGIDILREAESLLGRRTKFLVLEDVKRELESIRKGHGKDSAEAGFALDIVSMCDQTPTVKGLRHSVDGKLITLAKRLGAIVATNDKLLRRRLRDINVPTLYVRDKSKLELEGIEPAYI